MCVLLHMTCLIPLFCIGCDHFWPVQAFVQQLGAETTVAQHPAVKSFLATYQAPPDENKDDAAAAAGSGEDYKRMESVNDMHSKVFQAGKLGFVVDAFVTKKDAASVDTWRILAIEADSETATLLQQVDGEEGSSQDVSIEKLVTEWRLYKGKVCERLPDWGPDCAPHDSVGWAMEQVRGAVALALAKVWGEHRRGLADIELFHNPFMVKAKADIKEGKLILPAVSQRIDSKGGKESISLGDFYVPSEDGFIQLWLSPQYGPPGKKNEWVCPFWHVQDAVWPGKANQANMKRCYEMVKVLNIDVPVPYMTNIRDLKEGDRLVCGNLRINPPNDIKGKGKGRGLKRGRQQADAESNAVAEAKAKAAAEAKASSEAVSNASASAKAKADAVSKASASAKAKADAVSKAKPEGKAKAKPQGKAKAVANKAGR